MSIEEYRDAYMKGFLDGLEKARSEATPTEKPYFAVEDIMQRYDCGRNKAGEIMRAVRRVSGGGSLGARGKVKRSELLHWESIVNKKFMERLNTSVAK